MKLVSFISYKLYSICYIHNIIIIFHITGQAQEAPFHEFHVRQVTVKTGKNKGSSRVTVSLIIPPWVFTCRRKASEVGGIAYFSCNFCRNKGQGDTFAQALRVDDDDNGIPNYELQRWPRDANLTLNQNRLQVIMWKV